ncbi:hypothetical protein N177_2391 [Lutibaculum baratangense AMV1]|uniref:Uncharacterized protein n=1 Tax=Lutibaculum baratangense AMV1 TaxID=631454 RepID=V4QXT5_9HYPH|nr:hypothetical protein N177_2391 [Lutibaculum baratangense AMV1]
MGRVHGSLVREVVPPENGGAGCGVPLFFRLICAASHGRGCRCRS